MHNFSFAPLHYHHPRIVAAGERPLGDELRRELIIKVGDKHLLEI
jgi:hypothetical protein